jgi:hypothetical protein
VRILHIPRADLPIWNVGRQAPRSGVDQVIPDIPSSAQEGDIRRIRDQRENLRPLSLKACGHEDR